MLFKQLIILIMFFISIFLIIKEPVIKLGKRKFIFDYGNAHLISLFLLFLFGFLNFNIIAKALIGIENIVPWQVILIFFTGDYICIAIDSTGILEYFSFKIINWSEGNLKKLFFGITFISTVMTIFTSNDIVILTLTPIIVYMAKNYKINPMPYLFTMFFSANAFGMFFYVGNPPNIIVAQLFNLSFLEYAKIMFLPTLAAGLTTFLFTYLVFKKELNGKIDIVNNFGNEKFLRNKKFAIINFSFFIIFFIFLTLSNFIGLEVWQIMVMFFLIYFILSLIRSIHYKKKSYKSHEYHYKKTKEIMLAKNIDFEVSGFMMIFQRMPWKILPLIVSLFVYKVLFNFYGITDIFSFQLNNIINNIDFFKNSIFFLKN